jgi:hypothetical protein
MSQNENPHSIRLNQVSNNMHALIGNQVPNTSTSEISEIVPQRTDFSGPKMKLSDFEMNECIGRGNFGEIYRVIHKADK